MSAMSLKTNAVTAFLRLNRKIVISFFALFYVVGFSGTVISYTHTFFLMLFPWAILLSFLAVLLFNEHEFDLKTLITIFITAVSGFFIEVAGISTHQIFGNYTYGGTLGIKIFDTPLIIGVNWALLVFATGSLVEPLLLPVPVKILLASLLMVIYDILMEFTAPLLGMWTWENETIPVRNYIAWFLIALVFHSAYKLLRVKTGSSLAFPVLIYQALFFVLMIIYFGHAG
jgi:putative membrane protein